MSTSKPPPADQLASRAAVVLACLLLAVGGVIAGAGRIDLALASACAGLLALVVATWLHQRRTSIQLGRLAGQVRRTSRDLRRLAEAVDAHQRTTASLLHSHGQSLAASAERLESLDPAIEGVRAAVGGTRTALDQRFASLFGRLDVERTMIEQLPQDTMELSRLRDLLVGDDAPLPPTGGWAVSPTVLVHLERLVLDDPAIRLVVEAGSGTSTLWTALALRHRGTGGRCISLEHDAGFAEQTRALLARRHLEPYASVVTCPLAPVEVAGETFQWYDLSEVDLDGPIDLLFVDGPPGTTGPRARHPALPLLRPRLRDGSRVILDDTYRTDERAIVAAWSSDPSLGVVDTMRVGRATQLTLGPTVAAR